MLRSWRPVGIAFGLAALGVPFFLAGGLTLIYDVLISRTFRGVRPTEEEALHQARLARRGRTPASG
jgi:hypothetical protein